ncbi:MAG: hypothetical protein K8F91_26440, partial [Candidatus Obscuribacterales bacterium]|nr:hypothetical protein [Candidatus Obscuribacterales bacterium]
DSAKRHGEAIELLNSIDQSLGVCAMNLSALQKTAGEQTEAFKSFKETLQNQTFFEIGLNLNTLMESMSAALEPMKAVGELVPSIDQLVTAIEAKEAEDKESRLTPEKLVTALADQLSSGQIDPWTFRCAYMAVYPDEHPADLLHRLVELLGTQRLPGDLFRAAYDAIQTPEPPPEYSTSSGADEKVRTIKVQDESLLSEIEELRKSNEEFKSLVSARDGELSSIIEEREQEYKEVLNQKEIELKETQETLQARFEEFNARYDEMVETVNQREEDLQGKSSELNKKDSEIIQLKAQLDELQEQFRDTVGDLQKQLTSTKQAADEAAQKAAQEKSAARPAKPANSGGFFDTSTDMKTPLVDSGPARPLLQQQMETFKTMSKSSGPGVAPAGQAPVSMDNGSPAGAAGAQQVPMTPAVQSGFGGAPQTGPLSEPSTQAVPRGQGQGPTMSGSLGQSGSYGNGVRAQVFEVIVRQALAGAPWREICAGPMQVNNISPDEVEAEVNRRQALLKK